jgi:hypothetical protein
MAGDQGGKRGLIAAGGEIIQKLAVAPLQCAATRRQLVDVSKE